MTEVRKSPTSGKGLFATQAYRRGGLVVCEYTGRRCRTEDLPINRYLVEVDDNWTVDGSPRSNIARYINHSCKPNAQFVASSRKRIWVRTLRAIAPDEEITVDYGKSYLERYVKECRCRRCLNGKRRVRNNNG